MQPEQTYVPQPGFDPNHVQAKQRKIIGAIVLLGILLVIVALAVALLSGGGNSQQLGLISARQTEAIRILDEYGENASSQSTRSLVARTSAVFKSDLQELASAGISPSAEQQQVAVIAGIDEVMADAVRSSRFDQVMTDYLKETVVANRQLAEQTMNETDSQSLKAVLQTLVENYDNLL